MRVAILGLGRLGAFHAEVLGSLEGVTELRLYEADAERARTVGQLVSSVDAAKQLSVREANEARIGPAPTSRVRVVQSVDEALDDAEAAVIVTPTGSHAELIHRCLDLGLPIFCEKPISLDLASSREVVDHVARNGGKVQIGFQRRFDGGFRTAREAVRSGGLGTVYGFAMTSRDALPPPDAYIRTSGGQFRDQLIHDFDATRWLFGDEVEEVYAMGSTLGFDHYAQWGDVATSAVLMRLRGGAVGSACAARHNEAGYDIRVEIYGAKDTVAVGWDLRTPVRADVLRPPIRLAIRGRSVEVRGGPPEAAPVRASYPPPYPNFFERFDLAYRAELAHFLRFARGDVENLCAPTEAHEALRIAEAATLSLKERRPVRLQEIAA